MMSDEARAALEAELTVKLTAKLEAQFESQGGKGSASPGSKARHAALVAAHADLERKHAALAERQHEESEALATTLNELGKLREESAAAVARAVEIEQAERQRLLAAARDAVRSAEDRLASMNARRRDMCNRLQEASGAIRVICRCRPLSKAESASSEGSSVTTPSHNAVALAAPMPPIGDGARADFTFDASFGVASTQAELYEEVSPAIASVLSGQYVCVMAYGQTGAGKTYTMQGSATEAGIVHLAVDELLREARSLSEERAIRGDQLEVGFEASLLEIYNEKVLDLMAEDRSAPLDSLDVRTAADGSVNVAKLRVVAVRSAEEVGQLLLAGGARRHTHGTLMNASSSRSHLILTLYVTIKSRSDGSELKGKLHLVDLAGSERVGKSGVVRREAAARMEHADRAGGAAAGCRYMPPCVYML